MTPHPIQSITPWVGQAAGPVWLRGIEANNPGTSVYHFFVVSTGVESPGAFWGKW